MNWAIFATLVAQIEPPLMSGINGMIGALSSDMAGVLKAGIVVWLAGSLLVQALSPEGNPLSEMERKVLRGAIGFLLATQVANYGTYVRDVFLALPTGIAAHITSGSAGTPINGQAFDMLWNKAWVAGLAVYQTLGVTEIALQLLVVAYWFIALCAIGAGFLVWMMSKLLLILLVGTGPLFVALFVFPMTKGWFQGWLNGLVSAVICQVFVVALLTILIAAENTIIAQIASSTGTGITAGMPMQQALAIQAAGAAGNAVQSLQLLLGGMLLFFICGLIVTQLPSAAASIGHGASFYAGPIAGAAFGAVGGAFSKAGAAASAGVNAAAGVGQRASSTVRAAGMSLSRANP